MKTFKYTGLSSDGVKLSGVIQGYDEFEAVSRLRETCSIITNITEVEETEDKGTKKRVKIKEKELAIICSQFAIILTSGLSIDRCVEMVAAQAKTKEVRRMLEKVAEDVAGGYSLAQSFENNCPSLPVTFIETVRAGEQAGTLELCFDRLHDYYDKSAKIRARVISNLTYPALVMVVAVIVFLIIMMVAVPMFKQTFESLGTDLPAITKGLMAFSDFILNYWWALIGIVLLIFAVRILARRSEQGRLKQAEWSLFRSPLHRIHIMSASAQFASTMSTLLTAGLSIIRALDVTSNVVSNYAFGCAVKSVKQGVEQGRSMVECMSGDKCFPKMLSEMTGVGERSGNLEETLDVIGDYFDNEVSIITDRLLSLLEPVITIGLAVITVILLLAVYLPLISMYGSV